MKPAHAWRREAAALVTAVQLLSLCSAATAATLFVDLNNPAPQPPYTSWVSAATNIQDAVDAAVTGDLVLVTNGVYQTGARAVHGMSNRVAVTKAVTVQSVHGPEVTIIRGSGPSGPAAIRCAYLTNGSFLAGFTLKEGATQTSGDYFTNLSGGGVWCESASAVVSNCVLVDNSAYLHGGAVYCGTLNNCTLMGNSALSGGGAKQGTLKNCTLTGNSASGMGGGAYDSTLDRCVLSGNSAHVGAGASYGSLNNCTLVGNSADYYAGGAAYGTLRNCTLVGNSALVQGGGVHSSELDNCVAYYNMAGSGENVGDYSTARYCCSSPLLPGAGNFTNAPKFIDTNGWSDLRLQTNSPCINAGLDAYAPGTTDLDGSPRIVGGTVDVGAYECQAPPLLDFYAWMSSYGLPTVASAVYADADNDRMNNWQEWVAGTIPTSATSALVLSAREVGEDSVRLIWSSVRERTYNVERASLLAAQSAFSIIESNIAALDDTTSYVDTHLPVEAPVYYRIGVSSVRPPPPGVLGFSSPTFNVREGSNATVTISRTGGSAGVVTVEFQTRDGTARNYIDYMTNWTRLTFLPGITARPVVVTVINDNLIQGDHTVNLRLYNPAGGARLGWSNATLIIEDNDLLKAAVRHESAR